MFPATVRYEDEKREAGVRVGIAPAASCAKALDKKVAKALAAHDCQTVLRATYTDASRAVTTTFGIAVFPMETAGGADSALAALPYSGVRAAAFPGTATAWFKDSARRYHSYRKFANYLVFATSGYSDGRPAGGIDRPDLLRFHNHAVTILGERLRERVEPCTVTGVVEC
ncbi:hypothetical protein [Spongiactinospora sp. TRM90649]|uniref:hypothetical protein n=1 Tax=Spongiactinospora sp. TRM90649 TaxID=3031114 RepID=UPI0023F9DC40|nr:hypothetical protein [Spongiactinospora sp. TRM90649]MDF5755591.1 hypothetical protein [Spongiactinospora sp. TRM90649]